MSFTRAQGIPKCKIGFVRGNYGKIGERLVEGGGWGVTVPVTGVGELPSLAFVVSPYASEEHRVSLRIGRVGDGKNGKVGDVGVLL